MHGAQNNLQDARADPDPASQAETAAGGK